MTRFLMQEFLLLSQATWKDDEAYRQNFVESGLDRGFRLVYYNNTINQDSKHDFQSICWLNYEMIIQLRYLFRGKLINKPICSYSINTESYQSEQRGKYSLTYP